MNQELKDLMKLKEYLDSLFYIQFDEEQIKMYGTDYWDGFERCRDNIGFALNGLINEVSNRS